MKRRTYVTAVGASLASLALAGCSEDSGGSGADDDDFDPFDIEGDTDGTFDNVELVSHDIAQTGDDVGVTGMVENTTDQALDFVEVEVTLNDGDTLIGEFLDTSDEEIDFLAPGNQWRFFVSFEDEDVSTATAYTVGIESEVDDDIDLGNWNGNESG